MYLILSLENINVLLLIKKDFAIMLLIKLILGYLLSSKKDNFLFILVGFMVEKEVKKTVGIWYRQLFFSDLAKKKCPCKKILAKYFVKAIV